MSSVSNQSPPPKPIRRAHHELRIAVVDVPVPREVPAVLRPGCGGAPPIVGNTSCDRCTWAYIASAPGVGDDVCTACALSGRRDALNASTIGGHAPAIACFMGRTLPQWAAARAALQRGAPPPHNVWISDVLLVVAVTLTGALLVAIAAVVALRREGWGHRVKASA